MFGTDFGARRLRTLREEQRKTPPPPQWSYPVVRERCSCGAHTETVVVDRALAEQYFACWRSEHVCPLRTSDGGEAAR